MQQYSYHQFEQDSGDDSGKLYMSQVCERMPHRFDYFETSFSWLVGQTLFDWESDPAHPPRGIGK
ncbi:hypothetical protein EYZ11_002141 [Aspergillus tanneri]|uniref:Uncharacterized protein n=1 Tax=Aspergillus tanneri TaxID=1220188 RepID=A0A4S3JS93_9EURO|nr:hypothetical protein EYZ11_002141 [Aspergillus tanneri]